MKGQALCGFPPNAGELGQLQDQIVDGRHGWGYSPGNGGSPGIFFISA